MGLNASGPSLGWVGGGAPAAMAHPPALRDMMAMSFDDMAAAMEGLRSGAGAARGAWRGLPPQERAAHAPVAAAAEQQPHPQQQWALQDARERELDVLLFGPGSEAHADAAQGVFAATRGQMDEAAAFGAADFATMEPLADAVAAGRRAVLTRPRATPARPPKGRAVCTGHLATSLSAWLGQQRVDGEGREVDGLPQRADPITRAEFTHAQAAAVAAFASGVDASPSSTRGALVPYR